MGAGVGQGRGGVPKRGGGSDYGDGNTAGMGQGDGQNEDGLRNQTNIDAPLENMGNGNTTGRAGSTVALDGGPPLVIELPGMEVEGTKSGPPVADTDPRFREMFDPEDIRQDREKVRPPQQPLPGWIRLYLGQPADAP